MTEPAAMATVLRTNSCLIADMKNLLLDHITVHFRCKAVTKIGEAIVKIVARA